MRLSAYIVKYDTGFAPNPFGRFCTLACCKPGIRRNAKKDDIIVGTASAHLPKPGHLIYAMGVREVLPYERYWCDSRFAARKPTQKSQISRRGDNIWYCKKGKWHVVDDAFHDVQHRDHDTGGENVLVATEFYYFGRNAIAVPRRFQSLLATTQGHKNTGDCQQINRFWQWVQEQSRKRGRIALPCDYNEEACRLQRSESDDG